MPEPGGRPTSSGVGRVLIAVYAVFAIAATGRSAVQLGLHADRAPVPYGLSALAAVVYIVATVALARDRRALAWSACGVELVGVLAVGVASIGREDWFPDDTVWSGFGAGYGYVPLVLPVAGLAWLVSTRRQA